MTVNAPLASSRLAETARQAGASDVLERLQVVSLATDTKPFADTLVFFLAQRERLGILSNWAEECPLAADLLALGRRAWAAPDLLRQLRPVGDEHLAKRRFHGYTTSHYLATMAGTRRAEANPPQNAAFVERLRLLALVRALEAADEGILRESHLAEVCQTLRQVSDDTVNNKWTWIGRIAHSVAGFDDFVSETKYQVQAVLAATGPGPETSFCKHLRSVLKRDFEAAAVGADAFYGAIRRSSNIRAPLPSPAPAWPPLSEGETAPLSIELHVVEADDESRTFAAAEVDPTRPAQALRDQGTGVVLQSLEDSQYLRHSWHRLNHLEEGAFLARAQSLMQDDQLKVDRLGTALTMVAMLTSRPLSGLDSMALQSDIGDDWSLNIRSGALQRRPPRFARRWRASDRHASRWVQPLASQWRIDLSDAIRTALRAAAGKDSRCKTVGDLWALVSNEEPLHVWFGRCFASTDLLERLTSPVVSTVIGQRTFEHLRDHAQARLVSSSTRSGLPSACTYGSYRGGEIGNALAAAVAVEAGTLTSPSVDSDENACGSELDVDLHRMSGVIREMTAKVDMAARHSQDWVDHHNHLTALCVIALLASTGARPVNSPFECLDWFDLDKGLLYVEDKHSGPTRGARLCVLSEFAKQLLCDHYLPHLQTLSEALDGAVKGFADEIRKIVTRQPECRLPLFFLLRAEPTLDWIEVSESQLTAVCGNPWPLPWNVFRHLQATQLRRWGLHPEIRDALLSHGDRGAESHGDFSWRIPCDDLDSARPLVNRLSDELGFCLPSARARPPVIARTHTQDLDALVSTPFGREARAQRRDATRMAARHTARRDIDHLLANRPPSSLAERDWDEVARSMLLRADGLPHPMASLRYEAFEEYLSELWQLERIQAKLPAVRYIPLHEAESTFTEEVIDAERRLEGFRCRFDAELDAEDVRAPRRPVLAGCLAALELVLSCRVGNFAVLSAVACNSAATKVVRFNGRFWLEWAHRGDWRDGRPTYRVPITERAAAWVAASQDAKKRQTQIPDTPSTLQRLVGEAPEDFGRRLKELSSLTSQENWLRLPGAMAAVLNGDRQTAALPHHDWVRTIHRAAPSLINESSSAPAGSIDTDDHFFRNHHRAASNLSSDALARCRTLFDEIQRVLSSDKPAPPGKGDEGERAATVTPQRRAADITRAVQASGFGHGDAPFVMAHYARHLLTRPKQTGPKGGLKSSTALRYWAALKPGFLDFAFDLHLPELEEEELTALYDKVVNAANSATDHQSPSSLPGHAPRRTLKDDSDFAHRALNELLGFHEFAREIYGLEDPDWSEIAPGNAVGHGRPGIVLPDEYTVILESLVPDGEPRSLNDDMLAAAFALLVCARFGLRGGEAVGLQRRDWIQVRDSIVVLVQSNHIRSLKNVRSRRQVPLVGALSAMERSVVDETLRRWEHREGEDRKSPLLPGVKTKSFKIQQRWISAQLLPLIKSVTENPASTIHHLRHCFACRLLALLCGKPVGGSIRPSPGEIDNARRLLMTSTDVDRRTLWAVARMLGHASPATTLKAYAHVMDLWLPDPPVREATLPLMRTRNVVDLDVFARNPDYLARNRPTEAPFVETDTLWVRVLRYLRLRALGNANAAWLSRLTHGNAERVEVALQKAVVRLEVLRTESRTTDGLLATIRMPRWQTLVELATKAPESTNIHVSGEWVGTIGASRQLVLFSKEHFEWAANFVGALEMTPADCRLVHDPAIPSELTEHVTSLGLARFAIAKADHAPSFQIDVARLASPRRTYSDRMALIPSTAGRIRDTNEMVLLWITWLCCSTAAP